MMGLSDYALAAGTGFLVAGFAYAAWADLREREVTDVLWQVLGLVGFAIGYVVVVPGGTLPIFLWTLVGLFVLQHLFAWDVRLGERAEPYADLIEVGIYIVVIAVVLGEVVLAGLGPNGVPVTVAAVLVTVLFARGLFEAGILFGGADAKALMIVGILVPMFPNPLIAQPAGIAPLTQILPFGVNVLMNSALFSVVIPLVIAVRNARAAELHGISGFVGYSIPVDDLPKQYVWVQDPMFGPAREAEKMIETSEDDRRRREAIANDLRAKGVRRVWVTPQIPFLVVMALGVVGGLLAGNVVFDVLFRL